MSLGMFNQAVAERDFVGVTDRRLMDRLKGRSADLPRRRRALDRNGFLWLLHRSSRAPKDLSGAL